MMLEDSEVAKLKLKISGFVLDTHMQLKCDTYLTDTYILMRKYFIKYTTQVFYCGLISP